MTTMEIVADKLIEEGSVTLGIELLEAECSEQSLPEEKAKLHLNLSLKLSQYTRNFTQARDHALKAQAAVMHRRDLFEMKCRILQQLGYCHYLMQDAKSQMQCYQKGLELCQNSETPMTSREEMREWFCCFAVSLFQATSTLDDNSEALKLVTQAQQLTSEADLSVYKIWIPMVLAFHRLSVGAFKEAEKAVHDLQSALQEHAESEFFLAGSLYCALLESTVALQTGNLSAFAADTDMSDIQEGVELWRRLPDKMAETLRLLSSAEEMSDPFAWLSKELLEAAMLSNFASILLQKGNLNLATELNEQASASIQTQSSALDNQKGTSALLLGLMVFVLETKARGCLQRCHFTEAQETIIEIYTLLNRHQNLIPMLRGPLHQLIGCYLLSAGRNKLAVAHFRRSMELADAHPMTLLITAFAEVEGTSKNGVSKAVDLLRRYKDDDTAIHGIHVLYSLISGLVHDEQGDGCAARTCLHSAIQMMKRCPTASELECQVFLGYGHMQLLEGHTEAASEMMHHAYHLAQRAQDPMATLLTIKGFKSIYAFRKEFEKERQLDQEYQELWTSINASLQDALKADAHKTLLKWDLNPHRTKQSNLVKQ